MFGMNSINLALVLQFLKQLHFITELLKNRQHLWTFRLKQTDNSNFYLKELAFFITTWTFSEYHPKGK